MTKGRAKALMLLGTGSSVGKSFLTAGLCRLFRNWGLRVAPFKAQNMSNNSYVTREGGEMGRAQAVQAECAGIEPSVHMNPVLLKPSGDDGSQVVIHGKAIGTMRALEYYAMRETIFRAVQESYDRLASEYEVLVIEGAGSPAEINLKAYDFANFRIAQMADAPCLLIGDIDRGGVFASLWGTLALLDESERERIVGLVINKFRGDKKLLEPGLQMLESLTGKKVFGVLPYQLDLWIEEEDAVVLDATPDLAPAEGLDIAVILLPRISNATDFQILSKEPSVSVRMIRRLEEFGNPDLVILPGTKSTLSDLEYLKTKGFAKKIQSYARGGGRVLGICGGFQMLGERIEDPDGVESQGVFQEGLSLLPIQTRFYPEKALERVRGRCQAKIFCEPVESGLVGYEIHMGKTRLKEGAQTLFEITSFDSPGEWRREGAIDPSGRILGTYLHGLFDEACFRTAWLDALWRSSGKTRPTPREPILSLAQVKERNYDCLARLLEENLNLNFFRTWTHSLSRLS